VGLLKIPNGVSNVFMMTVGYLLLSKKFKWSDTACILTGGTALALGYIGMGFTQELYQMFICMTLNGGGVGLFLAAYVNMPSVYIAKMYPKTIGSARAFTMTFFFVGMMVGSILVATIYETSGGEITWIAVASGPICATLLVCFYTAPVIVSRLKELSGEKHGWLEHTEFRDEVLKKTEGEEPQVFLAGLKDLIESELEERNYVLWSGHNQRLIRKALLNAIPPLTKFDKTDVDSEGKAGVTHMRELSTLMAEHGMYDAIEVHEEITGLDLHSHLGTLGVTANVLTRSRMMSVGMGTR